MAILVAGVAAANLALIYVSIAVSIFAAVTLAVGVVLRRRELFGETGAAPQRDQPGWIAAGTARPVPVRPAADNRVAADRGARREGSRRDGEQPGGLAARLRKAGPAPDPGSARWPASIAAKGAPGAPSVARGGRPRRAAWPDQAGQRNLAGTGRVLAGAKARRRHGRTASTPRPA